MNAHELIRKMDKMIDECDRNLKKCRDFELETYIQIVKETSATDTGTDSVDSLKRLQQYEEALRRSRCRKLAWPQIVRDLARNVERTFRSHMDLIDIEFESCSANEFTIRDNNNIIRIEYERTEFGKDVIISIYYSRDGGNTFRLLPNMKWVRVVSDRASYNKFCEVTQSELCEIIINHINRYAHELGRELVKV